MGGRAYDAAAILRGGELGAKEGELPASKHRGSPATTPTAGPEAETETKVRKEDVVSRRNEGACPLCFMFDPVPARPSSSTRPI